ncbi:MAG TPA: iron ABC transporter permease [Sphaerochaeta sp.]|nr:iron ABC transporter permease [Sphaerochaeta sp.]
MEELHRDWTLSRAYTRYRKSRNAFLFIGLILLGVLIFVALATGSLRIPLSTVVRVLFTADRSGQGRVIWDVRMPRVLAAVLVGAGLSLSGTVMQSVLRNPLASPYTLGLSSAAAFGASVAIVFFGAGTSTSSTIIVSNFFSVATSAFFFSLLSTAAILALAAATDISAHSMVLAGIAISSIFSAGLTLMQYLADSVQLSSIVSWTFGDLGRTSWRALGSIALVFFPLFFLSLLHRYNFNAMDSGEESARGLGVRTSALRIGGMLASSLVSATIVSFFGTIAFIGLLGPHIARRIFGADHRYLMLASPLLGAVVLLLADTVARTVLDPMVLPVGVLTSLLGGPLFISLLLRGRKR